MEEKIRNLIDFAQGIYKKDNGKELYEKYLADIERVTPQDIFLVENEQLKMGLSPKELLSVVDKLINVFHKVLIEYKWEKPAKGSFLFILMEENRGLLAELEGLKPIIKRKDFKKDNQVLLESLEKLSQYNKHLLKLENILFPYMEKNMERFEGLKIMWSLHDLVRNDLKRLIDKVKNGEVGENALGVDIGTLFFQLHGLVQKQELIMYPSASEVLTNEDFNQMLLQSFDYGFAFIEDPKRPSQTSMGIGTGGGLTPEEGIIKTETGTLTFEQMECIVNTLPVDITFVNADDKVAFFSKPEERFFPRSVAIIGRDVRNCHPHESVHVVEKIIKNFKENKRDSEKFWIQMKGMFVLIQYFAVRNRDGQYLGTLEVSQEISGIKSLQGEKRLLDDEKSE